MERVVFTVAVGKPKYGQMAMGLARSLHLIEDRTPRAVLTDLDGFDWKRYFDVVIRPEAPRTALDKLLALELTDAAKVLSLDCDMLAFRRLDEVFEFCNGKDLAVQGFPQSDGKWHGLEVADVCRKYSKVSIPRFNGGMIYYERSEGAAALFARAREIERDYAATGFADFRGNASEEVCVALAMLETGLGDMIPDETDFMSTGVGMVGKPRIDVLRNRCEFVCRRQRMRFIRPKLFHASRYTDFLFYWRQLSALERLERIEDTREPNARSPWIKARRSFGRRWLTMRGKI